MNINITCPGCGVEVPVNEAIERQVAERTRQEMNESLLEQRTQLKAREVELKQRQAALEESAEQIDSQVRMAIDAERAKLIAESQKKAREALKIELSDRDEQVAGLRKELQASQEAELDMRRRERELKEQSERLEIDVARQLEKERDLIRKDTLRQADEIHQLKEFEKDNKITDMIRRIEVLKHESELAEKNRQELNESLLEERTQLKVREVELKERQAALEESAEQIESQVRMAIDAERAKLVAESQKKAREALKVELSDRDEQVAGLRKELLASQATELDLRRRERDLKSRAEQQELEVARRIDQERAKIRNETLEQADEQSRLKLAEKTEQISQMQKHIEQLKRKSEQGSQQIQGEVLELDLENALGDAFLDDVVEPVAKGQNGADVVQQVYTSVGRSCGSILWESKRTKNWQKLWLPKLRDDQRQAGAECAVIVSESLPEGVTTFAQIDGVWVCSRQYAIPLAMALRAGIIEIAKARYAAEGRHDKSDEVYSYLCSAEFTHHLSGIVEAFSEMTTDIDTEERSAKSRFRKRRKQLERAFTGTTGLYGDLQGLIGNAMPEVRLLEMNAVED